MSTIFHSDNFNEPSKLLKLSKCSDVSESRDSTKIIKIQMDKKNFLKACIKLTIFHNMSFQLMDCEAFKILSDPICNALDISVDSKNITATFENAAQQTRQILIKEFKNKLLSLRIDFAALCERSVMEHLIKTWLTLPNLSEPTVKVEFIPEECSAKSKVTSASIDIIQKLNILINNLRLPCNFSVLDYWYSKQYEEPELFKLAKVVLATPAAHVSIERTLSAIDVVLKPQSTRISQELLDNILLLKLNIDVIDKITNFE
ncbi:uncharacterized protein LOC135927070 [Gordionus sp. m RMFG-2023]|uniref:uncharacterized protein LOC135927070 n=1 Tax=Gordionus sp. m RMFG-2023 TaxID=3053472 RepID=UPI0031FC575B